MVNRLHTYTRWPLDPVDRCELAGVDLDFCVAMQRIVGLDKRLDRLFCRAYEVLDEAMQELGPNDKRVLDTHGKNVG
jgi:hypothetical protein